MKAIYTVFNRPVSNIYQLQFVAVVLLRNSLLKDKLLTATDKKWETCFLFCVVFLLSYDLSLSEIWFVGLAEVTTGITDNIYIYIISCLAFLHSVWYKMAHLQSCHPRSTEWSEKHLAKEEINQLIKLHLLNQGTSNSCPHRSQSGPA